MPGTYAICRTGPGEGLRDWLQRAGDLLSVTLTRDEVSIVCPSGAVPEGANCDRGWVALKVEGPLPLQMTGVLSALLVPLSEADVPVFAVSTFDTDYILIKRDDLPVARRELEQFGHRICLGKGRGDTGVGKQ